MSDYRTYYNYYYMFRDGDRFIIKSVSAPYSSFADNIIKQLGITEYSLASSESRPLLFSRYYEKYLKSSGGFIVYCKSYPQIYFVAGNFEITKIYDLGIKVSAIYDTFDYGGYYDGVFHNYRNKAYAN